MDIGTESLEIAYFIIILTISKKQDIILGDIRKNKWGMCYNYDIKMLDSVTLTFFQLVD